MTKEELLAKLGKALIVEVRDEAIEKYEMIALGKMKSTEALEKNSKLQSFSEQQLKDIRSLVVSSIDDVLHNLLWMLEQHEQEICLMVGEDEDSKKENIAEVSDGLSGEIYTEDGWINSYSRYKENY
ncbi:hypothetical protein [Pseudoalteromonas luteoviolacea]|uniref:Uncharacterized protein n=1 Tax=Pseudoalteromonas luteoviolacea DSM 6061 TaxID=1365250 RepID=A0A166U894_9GAMM|nr:hypothetical protein [Pseudoalteromonas luteoviolacea]KZN28698.1 hypothetical protein N475_25375 [Pseudoalteromonas luteoviolacea DSM 6061]MBE0389460.1 hypothetical protein [Pseudoalteromonas luteoviolacea DSM 6061]